jgi:predicted Rossmann fold flavoprotein
MKIAIIGAGPAGIFLSLFLKDFEGEVCLFEQNPKIGEKLKLTGGGRMNVTNRVFGAEQFFSSSPNLLKNLFKSPLFVDCEKLLRELGIEYKWEGDRAILKSEDAIAEVERLLLALKSQENITPRMRCKVFEIKKVGEKFIVKYFKDRKVDNDRFAVDGFGRDNIVEENFDIAVICSGGMFRLGEVSDEKEIYKIVKGLGHSVTSVSPVLCPLKIEKNPLSKFSGVSLEVGLKSGNSDRKAERDSDFVGNILITHSGISGPLALDFSSVFDSRKFEINFLPDVKENEFVKKFKEARNGKTRARGFLKELLPIRIVDFHLEKIGIKKEANVADVSAGNEKALVKNLFHFELNGEKFSGYENAWTTKGGVPLDEVNVSTLESRICPGLYFAGEVLDVNGLCGGYNISFAMVSAKIVGEGILKN